MDQGRKAKDVKTPIKMTLKTLRTQASKLMAKIEGCMLDEDQEVNLGLLKKPDTMVQIHEMPSSEDVKGTVDQMHYLKMKKTEDLFVKFDQLSKLVVEVESSDAKSREEQIADITKALRAGVAFV